MLLLYQSYSHDAGSFDSIYIPLCFYFIVADFMSCHQTALMNCLYAAKFAVTVMAGYGPSGIRTAPSLSSYGSKRFVFHYILDHVIIDETLLLLERIHKRFFTYPVDYSRNPG